MTDPTPTPTASDWRKLCAVLLKAIDDDVIDCNDGPRFQAAVDRVRAALATLAATPLAPTREAAPRIWTEAIMGDGACILRDGEMVPIEEVIRTLNRREAAPVEQQGAEISDRELEAIGDTIMGHVCPVDRQEMIEYGRAVWARAQAARPAADQQEPPSNA